MQRNNYAMFRSTSKQSFSVNTSIVITHCKVLNEGKYRRVVQKKIVLKTYGFLEQFVSMFVSMFVPVEPITHIPNSHLNISIDSKVKCADDITNREAPS